MTSPSTNGAGLHEGNFMHVLILLLIYAFTNPLSTTGGEDSQPEQLNG